MLRLLIPGIFLYILMTNSGYALDQDKIDRLTHIMNTGCALGETYRIQVGGDGKILLFKKGLQGEFSATRDKTNSIINFIASDNGRIQAAEDTRKCMKTYMDRIFDAILNPSSSILIETEKTACVKPKSLDPKDIEEAQRSAFQQARNQAKREIIERLGPNLSSTDIPIRSPEPPQYGPNKNYETCVVARFYVLERDVTPIAPESVKTYNDCVSADNVSLKELFEMTKLQAIRKKLSNKNLDIRKANDKIIYNIVSEVDIIEYRIDFNSNTLCIDLSFQYNPTKLISYRIRETKISSAEEILRDARVLMNGKIRIGVRFDAPPYGSYKPKYNCDPSKFDPQFNPQGYDIDIARKLAWQWLGDEDAVEFRCVPLSDRQAVVNQGEYIRLGIFSFSKTPKRCVPSSKKTGHPVEPAGNRVWCSESYMLDGLGVMSYEGSVIRKLCDVSGQRVVVSESTTADRHFKNNAETFCGGESPSMRPASLSRDQILQQLSEEKFPAYATNVEILNGLARVPRYKKLNLKLVPGKFGPEEEFVIAVTPGEHDLLNLINQAIDEWKKNRTLYDLMVKHKFTCMEDQKLRENLCGMVPITKSTEYIVKPGDTLSGLAVGFHGDDKLWRCIRNANETLKGQTLITVGQKLTIPAQAACPQP